LTGAKSFQTLEIIIYQAGFPFLFPNCLLFFTYFARIIYVPGQVFFQLKLRRNPGKKLLFYLPELVWRHRCIANREIQVFCIEAKHAVCAVVQPENVIAVRAVLAHPKLKAALVAKRLVAADAK